MTLLLGGKNQSGANQAERGSKSRLREEDNMHGFIEYNWITKLLQDLHNVPNFKAFDLARKLPSGKKLEEIKRKQREEFIM